MSAAIPPALLQPGGGPFQIGIVVPDLERAVRDYQRLTGRGPFGVWTYDRTELVRESHFRGEDAPYGARIAIDAEAVPQIEYIEPLPGSHSIVSEHVERSGYGLHHLGFKAESFEAAIAAMEGAGFPPIQTLSGWGLDGDGAAVFFDTFEALGFWVEVVAPAARRRPPETTIPA